MEPALRDVGLRSLAIGPDKEEAAGLDDRALRERRRRLAGEVVREEIAGKVGSGGSRVVQLDPVIEVAVGGVGEHGGIGGEDLVDDDLDLGHGGVVGLAWRGDVEGPTRVGVAVGNGPDATPGREAVVFEPVHDGGRGRGALGPGQDDGACRRGDAERGVKLARDGLRRLVVEPDQKRAPGGNRGVGRDLPALGRGEGVAKPKARDVGRGVRRVEQLDERVGVARVVRDGGVRCGDHLVDPDGREGGEGGPDGVCDARGDAVGGVGGGGGPVGGASGVLGGVDQLQRGAPAVGVGGPWGAVEVADHAERDVGARGQEAEALAIVVEPAGERVEHGHGCAEGRGEGGAVGGEDEVAVGEDGGVGGKGVAEALEAVAVEVEGDGGVAVEQLDEGGAGHGGVVVDLVEYDPVAGDGDGPGVGGDHGVGGAGGVAGGVEGGKDEVVGGLGEGDLDGEGREAGPVDGVAHAIDGDVGDKEGGVAGQGGDGLGGGEVIAAVGGDGEGGVGCGVELAEDVGASAVHVVRDGGEGREAADVVLLVQEAVALDDGDVVGGEQRAVGGAVQGAPQHAAERGVVVEAGVGDGVLAARESGVGAVAEAKDEVDVPRQEDGASPGLAVEVHVLAHVVGP